MAARDEQSAFTLVELVVAMTLLALVSLALAGLITVGARSASSGERSAEQARRFRIATDLVVRQLRSAVPGYAIIESDNEEGPQAYFDGRRDYLSFITSQPQSPEHSGDFFVTYWHEEETLMMEERPAYLGYDEDAAKFDDYTLAAPLLYDVGVLRFSYMVVDFTGEGDWEEEWDASYEDELPSVVRIQVESATDGELIWEHEVPIIVHVMNSVTGGEDFRFRPSGGAPQTPQVQEDSEEREPDDDTGDGDGDGGGDDDEEGDSE